MNSTRSWRKLQRASKTQHDGAASDGVVHNHESPGGQSYEKHGEYLRGAARAGVASPSILAGEGWPVSFCLLLRTFHPDCLLPARAPEYKGASFLVHRDPVRPDGNRYPVQKSASSSRFSVLSSQFSVLSSQLSALSSQRIRNANGWKVAWCIGVPFPLFSVSPW